MPGRTRTRRRFTLFEGRSDKETESPGARIGIVHPTTRQGYAVGLEAPPFDFGPDYSLEAWKLIYRDVRLLSEGRGLDGRDL